MSRVEHIGGRATLYLGDCRDILPTLSPASIDCIVTDPPYGITSFSWDKPVPGWVALAGPCLALHGSIWSWGSLRSHLSASNEFRGWILAQDIVWEKHNGSSFHADRFRRVHEIAAHWYPANIPWGDIHHDPQTTPDATARTVRRKRRPPQMGHIETGHYTSEDGGPRLTRSVIYAHSDHGHAEHGTQKPVAILAPLIAYSCPAGGLVLDPFAGSGSSGVAALLSGRRFIGIEKYPEHFEMACRRLSDAAADLFGAVA